MDFKQYCVNLMRFYAQSPCFLPARWREISTTPFSSHDLRSQSLIWCVCECRRPWGTLKVNFSEFGKFWRDSLMQILLTSCPQFGFLSQQKANSQPHHSFVNFHCTYMTEGALHIRRYIVSTKLSDIDYRYVPSAVYSLSSAMWCKVQPCTHGRLWLWHHRLVILTNQGCR